MNKKVNTFIIGQPRCGTTSLYSYLKLSRDIFLPEQKQLYHFEKDYNEYRMSYGVAKNMMRNYYNFSLEDYHKHFDNIKNEKIIAEVTPSYLFSDVAAKEIHNYNPNAKLIAIFRNPIKYIESIHKLLCLNNIEQIEDLVEAVKASDLRKSNHYKQSKKEKKEVGDYYLRVKYSEQLSKYLDLFGKENIKILFYEDFKKDNQRTLDEICKFLSIDNIIIQDDIKENSSRQSRFGFLISILNSKVVNFLSYSIPKNIRSFIGKLVRRASTSKSKSNLSKKDKTFLYSEFKSEIDSFAILLKERGYTNSLEELEKKWKI